MFNPKVIFTADIHFYPNLEKYIKNPFQELIDTVKKTKPLIVCLCGDTFDNRLSTDNSYYQEKIQQIIELSKLTKYLIILQGTLSHDQQSLSIFDFLGIHYIKNIFYIKKKQILKLDELSFLCLPEEYPLNTYNISWQDYYNFDDLKHNPVDFIIGHGNINGAKLHSKINNLMLGTNGFDKTILNDICTKVCVFGHIHIPQQLTDKVYYAGSLARTHFGDEENKRLLIYDLEQKQLISQTLETPTKFLTIDKNSETILNQNLNSDNVEFRIKGTKEFISKIQEQTKEITISKTTIETIHKTIKNNFLNELSINDNNDYLNQFKKCLEYDIQHGKTRKKEKDYLNWLEIENKIKNIITKNLKESQC